MRREITVLAVAALLVGGCSKHEDSVVARVGNRTIDVKELQRSYGLHPQWKKGETELGSYRTQLEALITQKIYAQEAEKLGVDRDSVMQEYLRFLRDKEMIKGLYRREILGKVKVDSLEVRRLYEWSKKTIDYDYVFARDSADCAAMVRQMATKDVKEILLPPDSLARSGKRQGVKVGGQPPDLERILFTANLHDVRGPFRMPGGFAGVKITGWTQEKFFSADEFNAERQKFEKLIADRQADALSAAYIRDLMTEKTLMLNPAVFWGVAEHFYRRVKEEHLDPMKIQNITLTSEEIQFLQDDLRGMNNAVIATHRDGQLTVGEFLRALSSMPGSLRPRARTPENLKAAVGLIVRNQYLLKEADRQGLANDPEVLYEFALQRDETLASAYYGRRRGEIPITQEEVEAFRKRSPVSENQVFFTMNMTSLARDAKTDSVLRVDLPRLRSQYAVTLDTARVRSMLKTPDAVLTANPVRMYVREIFQ